MEPGNEILRFRVFVRDVFPVGGAGLADGIPRPGAGCRLRPEPRTDGKGRIGDLLPVGAPNGNDGLYRLRFETEAYFAAQGLASIYPFVEVTFRVEGDGHYHIPITMSANGYATYRGN